MTSSFKMRSLRFGLMTSDAVRAASVLDVRCMDDLVSVRLGATREALCGTCGQAHGVCDGHFGCIELPFPLVHPLHARVAGLIARSTCSGCGRRQQCSCEKREGSSDVCSLLLVARPEEWHDALPSCSPADLVMTSLPVPPLVLRPHNDQYANALTSHLAAILRSIARYQRVRSNKGTAAALQSARQNVARRVNDYFHAPSDSRSPGLCVRLTGKQGRMRNNLMGFRVNSAGRCVVTPDPYCPPWEVRVPPRVCDRLGIRDGETVLFNRQPSLHTGSIMAHVARRGTSNTLAFSPTVTEPYNADYDGDEMNVHRLADVATRAEARVLMGVENNMVSPATGKPWVHLVQDCVLSEHLQGLPGDRVTDVRDVHRRQVDALDWIVARGFSVGLDDFCLHVPHVGAADSGAVARTAEIIDEHVPRDNGLLAMVRARSKGSSVNLVQLLSCVGWQTVMGQPSVGPTPESSSFVRHSYVQGMTTEEFWHHACAGREGLIQTAVKTCKTGYCQRKLVKFLEDLQVHHDGTVRNNATSMVVQFRAQPGDEPGTPVGIVAAQSIGQPVTQSTLNMFHHAGIARDSGLDKLQGILAPQKNPRITTWRGVADAVLHMPLRWSSTQVLRSAPSPRELFEARLRGAGVPAVRYAGPVPDGAVGWHVARRMRALGMYAHYDWVADRVICGDAEAEASSAWCRHVYRDGTSLVAAGDYDLPLDLSVYPTNSHATLRLLGIEAAREVISRELRSFGTILPKHYDLLADAMTVTGRPLSVNRTGLRQAGQASVLGQACFETVVQTITEAGRTRMMDNMRSASSRLAMGMTPASGTGGFEVLDAAPPVRGPVSEMADFLIHPPAKRSRFEDFL